MSFSSDDESVMEITRRQQRNHGKRSCSALPQLALSYSVPKATHKAVQEGEFVPVYKLLPGSERKSSMDVLNYR